MRTDGPTTTVSVVTGGVVSNAVGLAMAIAGGALAVRGGLRIRHTFPAWSAVTAVLLGAGVGASLASRSVLHGPASIAVGIGAGAFVGAAAARWYEVAVVTTLTGAGVAMLSAVAVVAHLRWWSIAAIVGAAVGALLGLFCTISSLHRAVLIVLTATAGSYLGVAGLMLLAGSLASSDLTISGVASHMSRATGWWITMALLAAMAGGAQVLKGERRRITMRDRWVDAGGGQLRAT